MLSTINILSISLLCGLLTIACWTDIRSRRIPNKLVLIGALIGIALHIFVPKGDGLFNLVPGSLGTANSIYGFATGLALLMPLYLLRTMGAGDVKLMAMIGAFLGPASVVNAALMTFIAGGLLAIGMALYKGVLRTTLTNVHSVMILTWMNAITGQRGPVGALSNSAARLPYALAISAGTVFHIVMTRHGYAFIS